MLWKERGAWLLVSCWCLCYVYCLQSIWQDSLKDHCLLCGIWFNCSMSKHRNRCEAQDDHRPQLLAAETHSRVWHRIEVRVSVICAQIHRSSGFNESLWSRMRLAAQGAHLKGLCCRPLRPCTFHLLIPLLQCLPHFIKFFFSLVFDDIACELPQTGDWTRRLRRGKRESELQDHRQGSPGALLFKLSFLWPPLAKE